MSAKATSMPTSSEAAVFASIVEWSAECPAWQRDALRRLCSADKLDSTDIDALLAICKGEMEADPLTADHVRNSAAGSALVILKRLYRVQHVNALAEGEQLTFDKIGLTVVYGDNGSGKSGYARILKKSCRARSFGDEPIHPNIYATNPGLPTASIDFAINGQNRCAVWTSGQPADPLLSAVSVFDSRTANVHVDQTNDVAYTPLPMKVLAALAESCQTIKTRLNAEISAIQKQTPVAIIKPACRPGTSVGKLLAGLSDDTKPERVAALAALNEAEKACLQKLTADLAADPVRTARQLQSLKGKIDGIISRLEVLAQSVTDPASRKLQAAFKTYAVAREAAQAASTVLFSDEPLPSIGSDAWRALWEAARAYSQREAYPGKSFPVTASARCVFCHQELSSEAADRLNRFDGFVKDESKNREDEAKASYTTVLQRYRAARPSLTDLADMLACIRDELDDDTLAKELRRTVLTCLWQHRYIERHHAGDAEISSPATIDLPLDALRKHASHLAERAAGLAAKAGSPERQKLIAERDELADRQWLGTVKADVLAEITRRKRIVVLQAVLKDTGTYRITTKSTEIAEVLVTNALRAQFAKEVSRLQIGELAIELRQDKSTYGIPRFKVCLTRRPEAHVGEVLSEGEHRCVALAAFLAELATTESKSTIVFDDPVSSLDHMHREALAKRLADEGQNRQVIVFTHDIAFLFLLSEACRDRDTPTHFAIRSISRGRDQSGFCNTNPPLRAQPLLNVIDSIQSRLNNEKIHYERGNQEEWERTVRSLQEQLRTTWERAVEETLAPVFKRMSHKVNTPGLAKVTVITVDDCKTMREAYGRCSDLLHSAAEGLNKPLPSPALIESEIKAMRDWFEGIMQRQKQVKT